MRGSDLKKSRLETFMTQYDLALKIGVTVDTIRRWERLGERELPFLAVRKINLSKYKSTVPETVNLESAKLRPDLALYGAPFKGSYPYGPEHPYILFAPRDEHGRRITVNGTTLQNEAMRTPPWSILESDEYKAALAEHRDKASQPRALSPIQEATQRLYEQWEKEQTLDNEIIRD